MLLPRQSQNNCYCRNIQWGLVSGLDKAILREATWSISKIRVSGGIGGGISAAGDQLLVSIRETVFQRSLPLATRDLEIRLGEATDRMGLIGATEMVISEIFKPESLKQWINLGYPDSTLQYLHEK